MEATTRDEAVLAAPAPRTSPSRAPSSRVWDLADASNHRAVRRRGFDAGGPVAAALGGVAIGAAVAPGLPVEARWSVVVCCGVVALLTAFSAIRRRQALVSLLLALAGLLFPLAAGAMAVDTTMAAKPTVSSRVVSDRALGAVGDSLVPSDAFTALPTARRADAEAFATALVLRLRTLHGAFGPYPASLRLSQGSVVEGAGVMQGTALGVVPNGARLQYRVGTSGSSFQVVVFSGPGESASLTATSALIVPGG